MPNAGVVVINKDNGTIAIKDESNRIYQLGGLSLNNINDFRKQFFNIDSHDEININRYEIDNKKLNEILKYVKSADKHFTVIESSLDELKKSNNALAVLLALDIAQGAEISTQVGNLEKQVKRVEFNTQVLSYNDVKLAEKLDKVEGKVDGINARLDAQIIDSREAAFTKEALCNNGRNLLGSFDLMYNDNDREKFMLRLEEGKGNATNAWYRISQTMQQNGVEVSNSIVPERNDVKKFYSILDEIKHSNDAKALYAVGKAQLSCDF